MPVEFGTDADAPAVFPPRVAKALSDGVFFERKDYSKYNLPGQ